MTKEEEIRQRMAEFSGQYGPHQTMTYTVVSVDESGMTCDVVDEDGIEHLLRLAPIITAGQSVLQYPVTNKKVLAKRFEDSGDWFVDWAEQYYKTVFTIGDCILETDGTKWTIKNAAANLKDIISNIIQAVQVVVVLEGNNPDFTMLTTAATDLENLMQ